MIELSRLRGSERYAACSDDVMAHRPYGSAQTGMYPFALYCGVGLPTGFLCQGAAFGHEREKQGKGKLFEASPGFSTRFDSLSKRRLITVT